MRARTQLPFFAAVSAGVMLIYMFFQLAIPASPNKGPEEVYIKEGLTFRQTARLLADKGYIRDWRLFSIMGRLLGADRRVKPGYYAFNGEISPWMILNMLRGGRLVQKEITIVEGENLADIKQKMILRGIMNGADFDRLSTDKTFLESLKVDGPSLEGYLYPDTYRFPKGTPPEQVLTTMVQRLYEVYTGDLVARAGELGLDTKSVLTLASMIQKEALKDQERPLISAVFYNRMKIGMPLQSDPTAVYGLRTDKVTKADLLRNTSYNTYKIKGLPPGPICCPGLTSIEAALHPAKVNYLYFVANYDGTHTFSSSYDRHLKAVSHSRVLEQMAAANLANSPTAAIKQLRQLR